MKYFNFLYYSFYRFFLKIGRGDMPEFKAMMFVAFYNLLYIGSVMMVLDLLTNIRSYLPPSDFIGALFAMVILVINYMLFLRNKKYNKIKDYFDEKKPFSRWYVVVLFAVFLVLPFVAFVYIALIYG